MKKKIGFNPNILKKFGLVLAISRTPLTGDITQGIPGHNCHIPLFFPHHPSPSLLLLPLFLTITNITTHSLTIPSLHYLTIIQPLVATSCFNPSNLSNNNKNNIPSTTQMTITRCTKNSCGDGNEVCKNHLQKANFAIETKPNHHQSFSVFIEHCIWEQILQSSTNKTS